MFKSIINFFRGLMPGTYLVRAAIIYQMGIRKAERLHQQTGHRFYLMYDPHSRTLRPITYHFHPGRKDSFKYLRQRGIFPPMNEHRFRNGSFYFTPSRNGAQRMDSATQRIQLQRLRHHIYSTSHRHR